YSPEGSKVSVSVKRDGDDAFIVVTDSGIGIEPNDRNRVFERFYRVDPARARSTVGTGLGLSIVKHVAASHGGAIDLWSEPGVGSTFTMRLPAWDAEEGETDDQNLAG
ncbi:MAG: sensor histidine kinase, partial [Actinomycetales bacterium]|nr:sensor histidine kinase [Actinomycetales bacterium]